MAITLAMQIQCLLDSSVPNVKIAKALKTNVINVEAVAAGEWNEDYGKPTEAFQLQYNRKRIENVKAILATGKSAKEVARMAKIAVVSVEALLAGEWDEERCQPNRAWLASYRNRRRLAKIRRLTAELAKLKSEAPLGGSVVPHSVDYRKLTDTDKGHIGLMLSGGSNLEEIREQFGATTVNPTPARPCDTLQAKTMSTIAQPAEGANEGVRELQGQLASALYCWFVKAFGRPNSSVTDPIRLARKLLGRELITNEQYSSITSFYRSPQNVPVSRSKQLSELLNEALGQAAAEVRRLSKQERQTILLLLGRGIGPCELSRRFGVPEYAIEQVDPQAQPLAAAAHSEVGAV